MSAAESRTSLSRALSVLAIVVERGEARVDELAAELGLPVSTVYRYLRDFRDAGFLVEHQSAYRPGPRIAGRRADQPSRTELRRLARPTLERLARESGETALIAVRNGSHALCLDQVESRHSMRMTFEVGQVLPLHAGAASRVLLAYAPGDVQAEVLASVEPITKATISVQALPKRLASIRATGFVTSRSELVKGAIAIACPVLREDACVLVIAIAAPEGRGDGAWQHLAKALLSSARSDLEALI